MCLHAYFGNSMSIVTLHMKALWTKALQRWKHSYESFPLKSDVLNALVEELFRNYQDKARASLLKIAESAY